MPKAFNCSMCSAPIDLSNLSGLSVRCHYCGNTVILPEELRDAVSSPSRRATGGTLGSVIEKAMNMAEIARLAHGGNKLAAIKLYRETYGVGLEDARAAVEQMAANPSMVFTDSTGASQVNVVPAITGHVLKSSKRAIKYLVGFIVLVVLIPIILGVYFALKAINKVSSTLEPNSSSTVGESTEAEPPGFASVALEFGSEGIGPGQFKDARSVAVDSEGKIYVAELSGGRIQVFDPQGKFITQWIAEGKPSVMDIGADRKGNVYLAQSSKINRYNGQTGELLGEVAKPPSKPYSSYGAFAVGLDGSIYALARPFEIVHIGPDGVFKSMVDVREKLDQSVSLDDIAVDGEGYLYVIGGFEDLVYKFGPDGKYINQFGGRGEGKDQFGSPNSLAVDGQGRVYVSDSGRPIHVFDGKGRFLDSVGKPDVVFGIAINDKNEIFATARNKHKIVKYVLNK